MTKAANPQMWEAGTRESLAFLLDKCLKRLIYSELINQQIISSQVFSNTWTDNVTQDTISYHFLCPPPLAGRSYALGFTERLDSASQRLHTSGKHTYVHSSHTHTHRPYITIWCPSALSKWRQFSGNSQVAVIKHYRHAIGEVYECVWRSALFNKSIFFCVCWINGF